MFFNSSNLFSDDSKDFLPHEIFHMFYIMVIKTFLECENWIQFGTVQTKMFFNSWVYYPDDSKDFLKHEISHIFYIVWIKLDLKESRLNLCLIHQLIPSKQSYDFLFNPDFMFNFSLILPEPGIFICTQKEFSTES